MQKTESITVRSKRKNVSVSIDSILYVLMKRNNAEIHVSSGDVYVTRMTLTELEEKLGEGFAEVRRGCLVSAMSVCDVTDRINLSNGESLNYTARKKKSIIAALHLPSSDGTKKVTLSVKIIRSSSREGDLVSQYISFCKVATEMRRKHKDDLNLAVKELTEYFLSNNILADFIKEHENEVYTMMDTLFNQERVTEIHVLFCACGHLRKN